MQGRNAGGLEVFGVHADDACQPPKRGIPDGKAEVAITRPARLGDVRVYFAVRANQTLRADQDHAVIVDRGSGIDFGEADSDVTIVGGSELREAVGGWAGDRFNVRSDFFA